MMLFTSHKAVFVFVTCVAVALIVSCSFLELVSKQSAARCPVDLSVAGIICVFLRTSADGKSEFILLKGFLFFELQSESEVLGN